MKMHQESISEYMLVPINGVIKFSDALLDKNTEPSEKHKLSRMINSCSKLLMCHVQDLLDNRVLEGGQIVPKLEKSNIKHLFEEIVYMHRMQARNVSGITIETQIIEGEQLKVKFDAQRT